jgi:hypothetical protein
MLPTPPLHCQCRRRAAAAVLPPLPPLCLRLCAASATLPMPPPCRRPAATAVAAPLPPSPCCRRRHCSASAALPLRCSPPPSCHRHIQRRRCAASSALALPTSPPHCPPSPRLCHAASAALLTLPPRIRRCRPAFATISELPPSPMLYPHRCCRPVFLLPHSSPTLSYHCRRHRHRCTADAALALLTPRPRCPPLPRCCHAAFAALPTLPPRSHY